MSLWIVLTLPDADEELDDENVEVDKVSQALTKAGINHIINDSGWDVA